MDPESSDQHPIFSTETNSFPPPRGPLVPIPVQSSDRKRCLAVRISGNNGKRALVNIGPNDYECTGADHPHPNASLPRRRTAASESIRHQGPVAVARQVQRSIQIQLGNEIDPREDPFLIENAAPEQGRFLGANRVHEKWWRGPGFFRNDSRPLAAGEWGGD